MAFAANPWLGSTQAQTENQQEQVSQADISAFQNAKIGVAQAINSAEQKAGGGKAIDAAFQANGGTPGYQVKVFNNDQMWEGTVDANTGKVVGQAKTTPKSQLDQEDQAEVSALGNAQTTLKDAVMKAEQQSGGKAISAGLEQRNGKTAYEIQIVKNGAVQAMNVDPQTGQVTQGFGS